LYLFEAICLRAAAQSTGRAEEVVLLNDLKPGEYETNRSPLTHGKEYYQIVFDP
jgi:hypothetical protein